MKLFYFHQNTQQPLNVYSRSFLPSDVVVMASIGSNWTMLTSKPWRLANTHGFYAPGIQFRCRTNHHLMLSPRPVRECHLNKAMRKASMRHYQLGLSLLRSEMTALSVYLCHSAIHTHPDIYSHGIPSTPNSVIFQHCLFSHSERKLHEWDLLMSIDELCNIIAFLVLDCVFLLLAKSKLPHFLLLAAKPKKMMQ